MLARSCVYQSGSTNLRKLVTALDGRRRGIFRQNRVLSTTSAPRTVYLNGEYIPESEAKISVFDRGLMFSDSVYEVTRYVGSVEIVYCRDALTLFYLPKISVLDGKLVDFDGHMIRLQRSLRELGFDYVPDRDQYLNIHRQLTQRNGLQEGVVYLQVTRGATVDRSFTYDNATIKPTVFLMTQTMSLVDNAQAETGIRVISIPDQRWGRCDIKTTQLLYQAQGKMQAKAAGVDDAWMVDARSQLITEGTSNNAWIVKDDTIVTRPASNDILSGITRATILRLTEEKSMKVEERPFSVAEVQTEADEAFCTSSSNFVMPVIEIDGAKIGAGAPGPVVRRLREIYIEESRKHSI